MSRPNSFIGVVQPYMFEPPEPLEPDDDLEEDQPQPQGEWWVISSPYSKSCINISITYAIYK